MEKTDLISLNVIQTQWNIKPENSIKAGYTVGQKKVSGLTKGRCWVELSCSPWVSCLLPEPKDIGRLEKIGVSESEWCVCGFFTLQYILCLPSLNQNADIKKQNGYLYELERRLKKKLKTVPKWE